MFEAWRNELNPTGNPKIELFHGTTTIGIKASEAIVLAADKRATAGHLIASRTVKKIVKITDNVAMTIAGVVADAQSLADTVRAEMEYYSITAKTRPKVKNYASLLARILFSSKWFPYIVQLIVGGYDDSPRLYSLDWYGSILEEDSFTSTGSGSPIALGVLEEGYRNNINVDEAIELAKKSIKAATMRDSASGDGIDVIVIEKNGSRELTVKFS